ncbi:DNA (cytosine-5-)-methyltransferase [Thiomicrorhabdus sp. 6S2-11]|uniref:Cytosine-specific methyltransferase n=1 Tax=Thiomicrorhabdus marina TaxID=2818442 RepID=A0ABS3Q749_9GAMM|nr:DNA (cytosine-5-)-methyltransferase [Thiomicrorhabdus marina]MBO1928154.1 DNA (cytosine-5-)-methyltransferase [Thiomicrorhabdus marina]
MNKQFYTLNETAELLSVSKETLRRWDNNGKLKSVRLPNNYRVYTQETLKNYTGGVGIFDMEILDENHYQPIKAYKTIELFAGAGGLALGLEKAGLECELLNEVDKWACQTLRNNRPDWNVVEGDIANIDFNKYKNKIDVLSGGFPCQAFSYAGKKLGFEDTRGTLFYEFARALNEIRPKIFIAENVRGLVSHDNGRTLETMIDVLESLDYKVLSPKVLKAINYQVPQKRERLFLVGIRKDLNINYSYPKPDEKIYVLKDALKAGKLYPNDVPLSSGQTYPESKKQIMDLIPPGGYWRDLPIDLQKQYMKQSYYLGGGKTGIARRISWDEPCLTLTTSPAQKQTERCHPEETRPFTTNEYARIQTFPDNWKFAGSMTQIYKQIGNAVPVNLGYAVAKEIVRALNHHTIEQELLERFAS